MTATPKKPRVLIVDDVPSNVKALAVVLKGNYQVVMAANGPDALEAAAKGNVDLILLDVVMPDMDGYEVCERLKANPETAQIPVIFVTGRREAPDVERGLALGAADYLSKPVDPSTLQGLVEISLAGVGKPLP
ncbi:MAG: response regulator [Magnetococcales bacterium]|nr:response regulator [Magnetococcales bacterium]